MGVFFFFSLFPGEWSLRVLFSESMGFCLFCFPGSVDLLLFFGEYRFFLIFFFRDFVCFALFFKRLDFDFVLFSRENGFSFPCVLFQKLWISFVVGLP